MTTFNFIFECDVCQKVKQRQEDILNCKFNSNVVNNITSCFSCNSCLRMKRYEDIYASEKYNKYCRIDKQIHCLFSFFDDDYKKLTTWKQKERYFKDIMDKKDDLTLV